MFYRTVATVLDGWRGDLSYGEVARRTGLSVPGVSEVLRGVVVPRPETIAALCGALGRTEADLMRAVGAAAPSES